MRKDGKRSLERKRLIYSELADVDLDRTSAVSSNLNMLSRLC